MVFHPLFPLRCIVTLGIGGGVSDSNWDQSHWPSAAWPVCYSYCFPTSLDPDSCHQPDTSTLPIITMALPLPRVFPRAILRRTYGTVQSTPSAGSLPSKFPPALQEATTASAPRTTWSRDEVQQIYETPLSQLTYAAV